MFHKITAYMLTEKYFSFHHQLYCTHVSCVPSNSISINRPLNVRLVKTVLQGFSQTKTKQIH